VLPAHTTDTAPAASQSSAAPPASPAAIPDGTSLDSRPPVAVGAGHARTQPPEAANAEQATHRQATRLPQGARGAHRPDVRHATDKPSASAEIRRLTAVPAESQLERRIERDEIADAIGTGAQNSVRVTRNEVTGYGSNCRWSH
jgi:hypothetical protein